MAVIQFGNIVSEARGRLGETVYSRNSYGAFVRSKGLQPNTPSIWREIYQGFYRNAVLAWKNITEEQRLAWYQYSNNFSYKNSVGNSYTLTGFTMFLKTNINLQICGMFISSAPPQSVAPLPVFSLIISALNPSSILCLPNPPQIPAGNVWVFKSSSNLSAGKNFVKREYRTLKVTNTIPNDGIDLIDDFVLRYNLLPLASRKIFIKIFPISKISGISNIGCWSSKIVS